MGRTFLGIDVGGTSIKWGVVSSEGEILYKSLVPTRILEGSDVIVQQIVQVMQDGLAQFPSVHGVGVGVPGVVNPITGLVEGLPNFPLWTPQPVAKILSEQTELKVVVENDANAAAVGELCCGAAKGIANFLYVTLGTGVGGAVVVDGRVYSGPYGNAGEIGHIIVDGFAVPSAEQINSNRVFRTGTLEEFVGRAGILKRANARHDSGSDGDETFSDVVDIVQAAEHNNSFAADVIHETGRILGIGLCSALTVLGVDHIIVGGGISQSDQLLQVVRHTVEQRAIPTIASRVKIIRARYAADAGLVGAAMLSLQDSFN